ncbi:ring-cleaving dioxygenase [Staphylococcus gallinarum]|uniref:Ring-cleaving dioxygenase n=1 Tax=Staphylococcus gallinarum TaxID=1293 RepID=A0A3A0W7D0_STAGA|nr:VOC family protein [Staphylococcus gallinarum]RIP36998.1 ring-cleaving dioxygenase [Staphylococcus gallinarum]
MHVTGHHHISMYTKNAQINKDFYTQVLGLRLVEKSVNQDNPTMYHLFFGDELGAPGTLLSFFEIPNIGQNRSGTDSIYRLSLLVPNETALDYYKSRLSSNDVQWDSLTYLSQPAINFKDPDGLNLLLLVNDDYTIPSIWRTNPYTDVPENQQILGMGPVELRVRDSKPTIEFLEHDLNYQQREIGNDDNVTVMTLDSEGLYTDFVVIEQQGERARPGQGYVHHIAVTTPEDDDLNAVLATINRHSKPNSGIIDRYFFKSLYYRQNRILFEFATEEPGFTVDTKPEDLGKHLNLPDFMEEQRSEIEANLHEL